MLLGECFLCCLWPSLISLRRGRPDCPFLLPCDVLGQLACGVSIRDPKLFDTRELVSSDLVKLFLRLKPEGVKEFSYSVTLSAEVWRSEVCPGLMDLLAELNDVPEWGTEFLFMSTLRDSGSDSSVGSELVLNALAPLLSVSLCLALGDCLSPLLSELSCSLGHPPWGFLWETLKFSAKLVKSKVVCAKDASLLPDTSMFLRYFSMSNALRSPTYVLLCSVSSMALWSLSWGI